MENIIEIANKIKQAGGNIYLVGGAVRDELLGRKNHDKDYCVTGIEKQTFQEMFPEAMERGKDFPVFDLYHQEIALARKEKKIAKGHKGFEMQFTPDVTIEEDLARRDITINSMAKDILTGEIIDCFHGIEDLENKIIRATSINFAEDPLRVYRVARFASQLNFTVEEKTMEQMKKLKSELLTLSKERVFMELKRALETQSPSYFFDVLKKANLLEIHFPEIYQLIGVKQPEKYHPEGDAYKHTMLVLDKGAQLTKQLEIRFSCLVHDLGKGTTPKEMLPHHYGHEDRGVALVESLGKRIGVPNSWIKCGKVTVKEHMRGGIFDKMTPNKQVEFIERVSKTLLGLEGLEIVVIADRTSRGKQEKVNKFAKIGRKCVQEVNGEKIMEKYNLKQGIRLGEKLHEERVKWIKNNRKN